MKERYSFVSVIATNSRHILTVTLMVRTPAQLLVPTATVLLQAVEHLYSVEALSVPVNYLRHDPVTRPWHQFTSPSSIDKPVSGHSLCDFSMACCTEQCYVTAMGVQCYGTAMGKTAHKKGWR